MSEKFYHGDPNRDNNFWVYPRDKPIHEGKSILSYHGDFNRDNHFWVYPSYKPLHNPAWDTYDASELCNNYTNLGTSS
ncbi:unnamed protein product [Rotaria magnacalcarata]|uniref:Uncharacterized protein n=1 Tax=Rotaria magnacalcarata TaxID=392030 RepID=A0A815UDZ7_9BILA|nr:unnamed protein product [Rotaria magnacalcarata]